MFNSRSLMTVGVGEGLIRPGRGEVIGGGSGNGIDVSRFADDVLPTRAEARERLGLPADATVVGFVGRFTRDKGIADLVDVFTSALRERPDVWLLLVGQFEDGDPVPDDVRATIEHDDRIVTVPWLDHSGRGVPGDGPAGVPLVPRGPAERAVGGAALRRARGRLRRDRHGRRRGAGFGAGDRR